MAARSEINALAHGKSDLRDVSTSALGERGSILQHNLSRQLTQKKDKRKIFLYYVHGQAALLENSSSCLNCLKIQATNKFQAKQPRRVYISTSYIYSLLAVSLE